MQCSICSQDRPKLTCASCAQSALWTHRYEMLLQTSSHDALAEKVHEYLETPAGRTDAVRRETEQVRLNLAEIRARSAASREARDACAAHADRVRCENQRRREVLERGRGLRERLEQDAAGVLRETKRWGSRSKALHGRTAEARSYLCREAAGLYGLRQKRRRSGRTDYMIGGVPIPNLLQDLSSHPHQQITTSLAHLTHLLLLVSHYLGLKLPNEIVLPTQSAPTTQIRGTLNARHVVMRPLSLDTPLADLSRDNPAAHTKFVEGVSLLAINVAYMCFTQGLEVNDVDTACAPGANMWRLLVSREALPAFGRMSHVCCAGNLATAQRLAAMARFRVGYKSVVEKIRNTLQGETMVADWDLVPDADGDVGGGGERVRVRVNDGGRERGMPGWYRIRAPGEEK